MKPFTLIYKHIRFRKGSTHKKKTYGETLPIVVIVPKQTYIFTIENQNKIHPKYKNNRVHPGVAHVPNPLTTPMGSTKRSPARPGYKEHAQKDKCVAGGFFDCIQFGC